MEQMPFRVHDYFAYLASGAVLVFAWDSLFGPGLIQKDVPIFSRPPVWKDRERAARERPYAPSGSSGLKPLNNADQSD